ncbi:MAG TPA: hypothetical protein VGF79_00875 [Bacteroidia bacterium]
MKKKSLALKFEAQIKADIAAAEAALAQEGLAPKEVTEVIEFVTSEAFEAFKASKGEAGAETETAKAPKPKKEASESKNLIFEEWQIRTTFSTKKDGSRKTDEDGNFIIEKEEKIRLIRDNVKISQEQANTLNLRSHDRNVKYFLKG